MMVVASLCVASSRVWQWLGVGGAFTAVAVWRGLWGCGVAVARPGATWPWLGLATSSKLQRHHITTLSIIEVRLEFRAKMGWGEVEPDEVDTCENSKLARIRFSSFISG